MKEIIVRVAQRLKKYIWLCLGVIIMCSLIGALIPFGKEKQTFTTEADVKLGSYDNPAFNNTVQVIQMITNKGFYDQYIDKSWYETLDQSLSVTASTNNTLHFTYTSDSEADSTAHLTSIINAFLKVDNEHYAVKKSIIDENITALEKIKASPETAVDKQRFLYDLQMSELDTMPASIVKDVVLLEKGRQLSAKDRGILGALLGITFSFFWVLIPERQTRYPKSESSKR
ncbi:hypothetical protein [Niallia sp. 01092]|uniref:hypothetical protein n=1 Tax=unclassified Niallia TaxID=2837522 RepID=UPI003FD2A272